MTREEKIKRLAELDGWTEIVSEEIGICGWPNGKKIGSLGCGLALVKDYLTSYDAIIPLIQKHWSKCGYHVSLRDTPEQLCDVLLAATGKDK